jgi:hypothetical protein
MVTASEFAARDMRDGYICHQAGGSLVTTSNYADEVFNTRAWDYIPLQPNTTTSYLTSSTSTTGYIQFNWYEAIKVVSIALIGYNGLPSTIEIHGSNDFGFQNSAVLHTQTLDGSGCVANTFTDWFDLSTIAAYKFLRVYFLTPWSWKTGSTTNGGIGEIKFKISDDTISNAGLYLTHAGYWYDFGPTITSQAGANATNAFNPYSTSAWRTTYAAIDAAGGCWLQMNLNSDTTRMNLRGFAIQQGQSSQYYGQGAPGYYSLKCSNTGAFAGEETTIIDNQLFDYGDMTKDNLCVSPFVEFDAPGLHRYYRWYFYSWTNLDHGFDIVPGIGKFYLKFNKATS